LEKVYNSGQEKSLEKERITGLGETKLKLQPQAVNEATIVKSFNT
jgi:hypothetical protein